MTYEIKLPQFEGPFDLLLFFIERDELDIYNIPISKITDDFLIYIHQMDVMDIELASEFIVVAATLMRIKAKMLLPRKEINEEGQEVDPRQELIERLVEYKKYKEIVGELQKMEEDRMQQLKRGFIKSELNSIAEKMSGESELQSVTLFNLLKSFEKIVSRFDENKSKLHTVYKYPYTIEEQKDILVNLVKKEEKSSFENIFTLCVDRIHAIFIFLALLELLQQQILEINVGLGLNNFWIGQKGPTPSPEQ